MLTRNCAINKLLQEGDFNVRVTVYDATKASNDPVHQKGAWVEVIRDSIGGGIINSPARYKLTMNDENGRKIVSGIVAGSSIADIVRSFCEKPIGLRISISPAEDRSKTRVWIFV